MATKTRTIIPLPGRLLQPSTFWESLDTSEQDLSVDRSISRLINGTTAYDVAGRTKEHWEGVVLPVVSEYLRINARKILRGHAWSGCVNCWMMGLHGSAISPHIVITHLDESVVKRYIGVLKRDQRVMTTGFKLIGRRGNLTFIMDNMTLAMGGPPRIMPALASAQNATSAPGQSRTLFSSLDDTGLHSTSVEPLCGMRVRTSGSSFTKSVHGPISTTLGGFVEVHGRTYTLLAAHPLLVDRSRRNELSLPPEEPEESSTWIIDEDDGSDLSSFDGSDVSAQFETSATEGRYKGSMDDAASRENGDTSLIFEHQLVAGTSSTPLYDPRDRSHNTGYYSKEWDWVLLPTRARPVNSYLWAGRNLYICDIAVSGPEIETLLILLRDDFGVESPRPARCSGGLAMIQPPGSPAPIPAIQLDCHSVRGNSGAWVVSTVTGDLHGIVVAMDEEAGITYMLRARDVLEDMISVTKGAVKLPQPLPGASTKAVTHAVRQAPTAANPTYSGYSPRSQPALHQEPQPNYVTTDSRPSRPIFLYRSTDETTQPGYQPYPEVPGPFTSSRSVPSYTIETHRPDSSTRQPQTRYHRPTPTGRSASHDVDPTEDHPQTVTSRTHPLDAQANPVRRPTGGRDPSTVETRTEVPTGTQPSSQQDPPFQVPTTSATRPTGGQRVDEYPGSGRTSQESNPPPRSSQPGQNDRSSSGTTTSRRPTLDSTTTSRSFQGSLPPGSRVMTAGDQPFDYRLQMLLRTFAAIPRGDFIHVATYVRENPTVLQADPLLLLEEAVRAHAAQKSRYSESCVQQAVILRMLRRKQSETFFRQLLAERSSTRGAFYIAFDEALKETREKSKSVGANDSLLFYDPKGQKEDGFKAATKSRPSLAIKQREQSDVSPHSSAANTAPYNSDGNVYSAPPDPSFRRGPLPPAVDAPPADQTMPSQRYSPILTSRRPFISSQIGATYGYTDMGHSHGSDAGGQAMKSPQDVINIPFGPTPDSRVRREETLIDLPKPPDHRFREHRSSFYRVGRVFAVPWHVPSGETAKSPPSSRYTYTSAPTTGPFGLKIRTTIRRMIVVRAGKGFCVCIQINTYAGCGLKFWKSDEDVQAHSIVHMEGTQPTYLEGEPKSQKNCIAVRKSQEEHHLEIASRLCYSRPHTVEHNVKSMDIGVVTGDHWKGCLYDVLKYYAQVNNISP